ncbi:MAG: DUF4252 domain-containing protein [Muribaculaceae bacterium]|nr:DUF4252 domain-containing protein [Muribaculaceae bacterium]
MKIITSVAFILLSVLISSARDLAEECEDIKDVSTVSINQAMLKLISFPDKGSNPIDLDAISSRLDKVQIISADEPAPSTTVKNIVRNYLNSQPRFERTMKMKDGDESVQMYMRKLPDGKNEFVVLVEDTPDITVVVLQGSISMEELANVTDL